MPRAVFFFFFFFFFLADKNDILKDLNEESLATEVLYIWVEGICFIMFDFRRQCVWP